MFYTKICEILNIQYPIIMGGMVWVGKASLAAAVSEAGGLGLLGAGSMSVQEIESETNEIKAQTKKPFGANIPLIRPDAIDLIDTALKCGASVISTSSGNPKAFTSMIHDRGAKVMHVVPSVKFAEKCEQAGVDIIVAEGFEAGGHNGYDEISTMALTPQIVDAVKTPVVTAGGIADGRGFIAALALGAQGIQMGTRFMATKESAAHDNVKNAVVQMSDGGTCITGRTTIGPTRCLKNNITLTIAAEEQKGTSPEKLNELIGVGRSMNGLAHGDCEEGSIYCGQIGGAVKQIKSAKDVVSDIIFEAQEILNRVNEMK